MIIINIIAKGVLRCWARVVPGIGLSTSNCVFKVFMNRRSCHRSGDTGQCSAKFSRKSFRSGQNDPRNRILHVKRCISISTVCCFFQKEPEFNKNWTSPGILQYRHNSANFSHTRSMRTLTHIKQMSRSAASRSVSFSRKVLRWQQIRDFLEIRCHLSSKVFLNRSHSHLTIFFLFCDAHRIKKNIWNAHAKPRDNDGNNIFDMT